MWIAVLAAAALGLTGCTHEVSGSPVEARATTTAELDAVLLDAAELDDLTGVSGFEVLADGDAPDDTIDADPPECHGVIYIAGELEYAPTNFSEMRWRVVDAEDRGGVVEMVARFPSAAKAAEFIGEQTAAWEACRDAVITSRDKASDATSRDRVTAVKAEQDSVLAETLTLPTNVPCQHVLQAVSDVIIDVSACGDGVSDHVAAIASELSDRLQTS